MSAENFLCYCGEKTAVELVMCLALHCVQTESVLYKNERLYWSEKPIYEKYSEIVDHITTRFPLRIVPSFMEHEYVSDFISSLTWDTIIFPDTRSIMVIDKENKTRNTCIRDTCIRFKDIIECLYENNKELNYCFDIIVHSVSSIRNSDNPEYLDSTVYITYENL